jgi:hypothetical protein
MFGDIRKWVRRNGRARWGPFDSPRLKNLPVIKIWSGR